MESEFSFNKKRIWRLCLKCAWALDCDPKVTKDWRDVVAIPYRFATAKLLFGTAAQESALRWERQRSPRWDGKVGAFSKWQLEQASIMATLNGLKRKPGRLAKATMFLFDDTHATTDWASLPLDTILWMLRMNDNDYLGVLLCREHYRRISSPIPSDLEGQARYWKQFYNTIAGKGTIVEYLANWERYCAATVAE